MNSFLSRVLLFSVLFWGLNSAIAAILAPRLKLNIWDKYHWLQKKHGEHYDIVFVGSSRVMNSVDTKLVDDVSGMHSLNLGMGGSGAADQYLLLQQFLKSNETEVVLLQLDYLTLMDYFDHSFREYVWLSYDDDPEVRRVIIEQCGRFRYIGWSVIPFLRMMEFSSQYQFFLTTDPPDNSDFDDNGGCLRVDGPAGLVGDATYARFRQSESSVGYLHQIFALCRQNGVRVVVFQSPFPSRIESLTDRKVSDAALARFIQNEQVLFWDFSRDLYHRNDLFFDRHHLNSNGVTVFSKMIGNRISDELAP
jgi:hypothetical protein